jgi:AraC-like DNA-binding protein
MVRDIESARIELGDHRFGRVNRRMPIGPVRWPFHDLFWVHEGHVMLSFTELGGRLDLVAPAGVLILPGTLFQGTTVGQFATASICHFAAPGDESRFSQPGFMLPRAGEELHLQGLVRLAMHLARRNRDDELPRRQRLLVALIDGFGFADAAAAASGDEDRLAIAWKQAGQNLHRMRTLADVAALLGISESALRALHRKALGTSAGEHLRELRLTRAEELLVSTDRPLGAIAAAVGYRHASTLTAAFRQRRGKTPGEYRHWSNPFA